MKIIYSKTTGRLTFDSDVELSINTYDDTYSSGSSIYQILGFSENQIYSTSNFILTSPYPANIISMRKIRICSSLLNTNSTDSLTYNSGNILMSIPVNAPAFGIIEYDNFNGRRSVLKNKNIDYIDITIYDQENNILNFNNSDWSITLALTTTRKISVGSSGSFNDGRNTILQEREIVGGDSSNSRSKTSNENDLDFFMYEQGLDI